MAAAEARIGKMKLKQSRPGAPAQPQEVQLLVSHPNYTGFQMNQLTRHYIPAHFVQDIKLSYAGRTLMAVEGAISLSEDPSIHVVHLDEGLDPQNDIWGRSVLVHELVHYLQQEEGSFTEAGTCEAWMKREAEAYEIQYRWLLAQQVPPRLLRRISRPFLRIGCGE